MTDATHKTVEYDVVGDDEFPDELPARPRRRFLTIWSALLMALLLGAIGFYVGIRVEKAHGSTSSTAATFSSALKRKADASSSTSGKTKRGATATGFPGTSTASANTTTGSVSSIDGDTLYVKESSGNTVKVKLSGSTTITKSETVSKGKVYPGDEITVTGEKGSGGALTAITVTDSGASSSSSSSTSSSTSGAVSSLFGGS